MKTGLAILLTIGLLIFGIFILITTGSNIFPLLVIGTSLWAAWDSSKIQLNKYKSGISYGSVVLFILCLFVWAIAFPWYLSMRYKIKNDLAQLKDQYKNEQR